MDYVSEEKFAELLESKLDDEYQRSVELFRNCGGLLSYDVTNVLLHAADKGMIDVVLTLLEEHHQAHLVYQHPEIRGTISGTGGNPTMSLFRHICEEVLHLQPA